VYVRSLLPPSPRTQIEAAACTLRSDRDCCCPVDLPLCSFSNHEVVLFLFFVTGRSKPMAAFTDHHGVSNATRILSNAIRSTSGLVISGMPSREQCGRATRHLSIDPRDDSKYFSKMVKVTVFASGLTRYSRLSAISEVSFHHSLEPVCWQRRNIGSYAVQLAANAGLHVISAVGTKDVAYTRNLGSETVWIIRPADSKVPLSLSTWYLIQSEATRENAH
jgi:hypothetical protein